ncbi:glutaredoxin family protein [uncultured Desulfosarcina sp.]|uniref:glutaredoxin family protein n=1 Tax=uncultured Desulfosarcina sp. TaxID=218289 RepID=UPI0029C740D9|nr:glutaredoxin family protein [uncultured Desulfosarcina sp.]
MFRFVVIILLLWPAFVSADLYQWTDGNGVKHFSNTPPENNTETMRQMEEYVGGDNKDVDRRKRTIDVFQTDTVQDGTDREQKKDDPAVVIYTTPTCGYCHQAKAYFNQHGIRFTEYDVTASTQARKAFEALNGRGVPLILIGDQRIPGFNKSAINRALGMP